MNVQKLFQDIATLKERCSLVHQARGKGFIDEEAGYIESYKGKFGRGYRVHLPSKYDSRSNSYHTIEYWILKKTLNNYGT